jgi:hypothetical protein
MEQALNGHLTQTISIDNPGIQGGARDDKRDDVQEESGLNLSAVEQVAREEMATLFRGAHDVTDFRHSLDRVMTAAMTEEAELRAEARQRGETVPETIEDIL